MQKRLRRGASMKKKVIPISEEAVIGTPPSTKDTDYLPKQIKARWRSYSIKYPGRIESEDKDEDLMGIIDYHTGVISILSRLCDDEKKSTALHELYHGYLYDAGIDYMFSAKEMELLCQLFSSSVIDLIRQNPEVVKWIQDQKNEASPDVEEPIEKNK